MVAKMLLFTAVASVALASASARSLKQVPVEPIPGAVAFADAFQYSQSFNDDNSALGVTEADTTDAEAYAYADSEGSAGYIMTPFGNGNSADAIVRAISRADSINGLAGVPDAQSFSDAISQSNARARTDSVSVAAANAPGASALARSDGYARAGDFAGARTNAFAGGNNNAISVADSVGLGGFAAESNATADSIAQFGDAFSTSFATSDSDDTVVGGYSDAYSVSDSLAVFGGGSNSFARSRAYNNQDSEARASARSQSGAAIGGGAGAATSRATSLAAGGLAVVPVPPMPPQPSPP